MTKLQDDFSGNPDFIEEFNRLVSEQKFGEAINYLQKIIDCNEDNIRAKMLLEQLKMIHYYQSRDVFASTNLHLDPWFE